MPSTSHLIGLPVLICPDLRRVGRVQDALVAPDGRRICGLVVDGGGWFRPRRALDYRAVQAVGPTCVLAAREAYLAAVDDRCCSRRLVGKPVLTSAGDEVGTMDDIHFDATSGDVTALQVSHGFVDDLLDGKQVLQAPGSLLLGDEAILMAPDDWGDPPGGALLS